MPVTVDRKFLLEANGQTLVLSGEEMQAAKTETVITITCAGPKCQARNQRPEPFSVTWTEEEVAKDPLKLPDAFFGMIKLGVDPTKPQELVFCGPQCVRDYLQYSYMPPQPPRIALENAKKEQAKKLEELNPHLTPGQILAPEQALERGLKATMQKIVQTPEGPQVVPDPEVSAKIDAISESMSGSRKHLATSEYVEGQKNRFGVIEGSFTGDDGSPIVSGTVIVPEPGNYEVEYQTEENPPTTLPPNSGSVLRIVRKTDSPTPEPQADGDPGE